MNNKYITSDQCVDEYLWGKTQQQEARSRGDIPYRNSKPVVYLREDVEKYLESIEKNRNKQSA